MTGEHPRSGLRRLLDLGVNLALLAAILLALAFLAPSLLGYERYVITGGSMSGTIEKGSVVFERPVAAEALAVGDVITYLPPADSGVHTLVTHRIIGITRDAEGRAVLRTQGDAISAPDPWRFSLVDDEQPVVEYTVPYVGTALIALADPAVRRLVIGVPAGVVALIALGQLVQALRSRPSPQEVPNCGTPVEIATTSGGTSTPSVDHDAASASPGRVQHCPRTLTSSHSL